MAPPQAKSVLFLSADLVGSTSYKQQADGWQKIFLSFYREFPQALADASREYAKQHSVTVDFDLWKAIGDELIFKVEVRSEADVSNAVRVWLQAVTAYENDSLEEVKLALKGGAFIATFPGPDSESSIPRSPADEDSDEPVVILNDKALSGRRAHTKYLYDYFGPSVDTGFRVAGLASRRYFTMTIEVVWALASIAHAQETTPGNGSPHHVRDVVFRGREPLKGVWRGQEYPVFAVDREISSPLNEALAKLNGSPINAQSITHVCKACSESEGWPSRLYLPDAAHEAFKHPPVDAMQSLRENEAKITVDVPTEGADEGEPLQENAPLG
ncbi:hypothetical protein [Microbacterium esteraromaticum]|uniref:hypothetical protein n=1 Tax=Microbacterium esteraromaticum TaxID=57043 RepID=UPI001959E9F3|nr:hypothetical protein [Microbacterium esteraromaticum]MBM7465311.1 hypothetical protein [Microbacterium esteraromaticum]